MDYQLLEWDTNFFGMKVARITDPFMSIEKVASTLAELKVKRIFLYLLACKPGT